MNPKSGPDSFYFCFREEFPKSLSEKWEFYKYTLSMVNKFKTIKMFSFLWHGVYLRSLKIQWSILG
jgi:hypothetical protein